MKILRISFFSILCLQFGSALQCWNCDNANNNIDCLRKGRATYCSGYDPVCEDEIRSIGKKRIIGKRCKQRSACQANVEQNVRRCCCDKNMCNKDFSSCFKSKSRLRPPVNSGRSCKQIVGVPPHITKYCSGNEKPGAFCEFKCDNDYMMIGNKRVFCKSDYTWDGPLPRCKAIFCPTPPRAPKNGFVKCTNWRRLHSHCRFSCRRGFKLSGNYEATCADARNKNGIGMWTGSTPFCKPLFCWGPPKVNHGTVTCSRGKRANSVCRFRCDKNYEIYPKNLNRIRCLRTEKWSISKMPCCALPCPPNLVVDFFVVMDSSSSVGPANWVKMKKFVRSFLDDFEVRENAAQYSIVRYNSEIDKRTQIFLDDFPNDKNALLTAFDAIPYNGTGTKTGKALNYVARTLLRRGNRKEAKDVVLLITDGAANDRVAIPARNLRSTGALVYVLPIRPPRGYLNMRQIRVIAGRGKEKNILQRALVSGFEALNEEFAREMSHRLCSDPCFDPFA